MDSFSILWDKFRKILSRDKISCEILSLRQYYTENDVAATHFHSDIITYDTGDNSSVKIRAAAVNRFTGYFQKPVYRP